MQTIHGPVLTPPGDAHPAPRVRVLVVDEDPGARARSRQHLQQSGRFEVEAVPGGREALLRLALGGFRAAVVDPRMQRMDGLAFIAAARRLQPDLALVIVSDGPDDGLQARLGQLGLGPARRKSNAGDQLAADLMEALAASPAAAHPPPDHRPPDFYERLRRLGEAALQTQDVYAALNMFCAGIRRMLGCDCAGALGFDNEASFLLLHCGAPPPPAELERMQREILGHYELFTGRQVNLAATQCEVTSNGGGPAAGALPPLLVAPMVMRDHVAGILALGFAPGIAPDDLRLAAGHLAMVLSALDEMRQLAIRDTLTGLYNRRFLENELEGALQLSQRYQDSLAVLFIDIDHFKPVNDQGGHELGDRVLKLVAGRLRQSLRATDIIIRYGGDEFVVILPQAASREAVHAADRILDAVRNLEVLDAHRKRLEITLSIGITVEKPAAGMFGRDRSIQHADAAMYRAKQSGRNRYALWTDASEAGLASPPAAPAAAALPAAPAAAQRPLRVLVVDDQPTILRYLERILKAYRYEAVCVQQPDEALAQLRGQPGTIDIVIADINMPDMDGYTLIDNIRKLDDTVIRVLITGQASANRTLEALRRGAHDFLEKPFSVEQFVSVMDRAREYRRLALANAQYQRDLINIVNDKSAEVMSALDKIKATYQYTFETMVAMLDAREHETAQHSTRVRDVTMFLARQVGLAPADVLEIGRGAFLHDLGKIGIPDSILLKPGSLSADEWEVMKKHPEIGHSFLRSNPLLATSAEMVLAHHERYDGTGYPRRLRGEQICIGARLFAIVDSYDAMRSHRVYKQSLSRDAASAELLRQRGIMYDPALVDIFIKHLDAIEALGRWNL